MSGMTREEAIKQLKFDIAMTRFDPITGEQAFLGKQSLLTIEAEKMAIADMEKQIPKKPTETNEKEDGSFYRLDFMCPSCNTSVIGQPYKPRHCKHCGQALDWSEEND